MNESNRSLEAVLRALSAAIKVHIARPLYLKVEHRDGELVIEQIEFLSVEEFAKLMKTQPRTVYGWFDKGLLTFCKPQGTGQNLIPLSAALHWISSSVNIKEPRAKNEQKG